jgi:hypothetical protein
MVLTGPTDKLLRNNGAVLHTFYSKIKASNQNVQVKETGNLETSRIVLDIFRQQKYS